MRYNQDNNSARGCHVLSIYRVTLHIRRPVNLHARTSRMLSDLSGLALQNVPNMHVEGTGFYSANIDQNSFTCCGQLDRNCLELTWSQHMPRHVQTAIILASHNISGRGRMSCY